MAKTQIGRPLKAKEDMSVEAQTLRLLQSISKKVDSVHSQLNVKDKDYLTANEACQYMGVTRATLWKWCNESKLNRVKLTNGKIYYASVELKRLLDNGADIDSTKAAQVVTK